MFRPETVRASRLLHRGRFSASTTEKLAHAASGLLPIRHGAPVFLFDPGASTIYYYLWLSHFLNYWRASGTARRAHPRSYAGREKRALFVSPPRGLPKTDHFGERRHNTIPEPPTVFTLSTIPFVSSTLLAAAPYTTFKTRKNSRHDPSPHAGMADLRAAAARRRCRCPRFFSLHTVTSSLTTMDTTPMPLRRPRFLIRLLGKHHTPTWLTPDDGVGVGPLTPTPDFPPLSFRSGGRRTSRCTIRCTNYPSLLLLLFADDAAVPHSLRLAP